jgi:tRNA uridine 5-carboxymethylaminomethyl modification enzyme
LIAGINAARKIDGKEAFVPDRSEAYIGVLIDDLVTKGTNEPYRIMTSRAEFRLVLRQDNADLRLTEKGYRLGLATRERYERYLENKRESEQEMERLETTFVTAQAAERFLEQIAPRSGTESGNVGARKHGGKISLAQLLKRPEVTYDNLAVLDEDRPSVSRYARRQAEIQIKYEGYIDKQNKRIEQFKKLENKRIPSDVDYEQLRGLRLEAAQKLNDLRPKSVGQASRISGVSPADINVLMIHLTRMESR